MRYTCCQLMMELLLSVDEETGRWLFISEVAGMRVSDKWPRSRGTAKGETTVWREVGRMKNTSSNGVLVE